MDQSQSPSPPPPPTGTGATRNAIAGLAFGLFIGGAICLYFGFTWMIDAPGSADEQATQTWFMIDHVFQWVLRILGIAFLLAASGAAAGQRASMLLATICEAGFALLMLVMAIETSLEARADGGWDATVILFGVLAALAVSGARQSWRLFTATGHAEPQ